MPRRTAPRDLKEFGDRIRVIPNRKNVGFAAAQNQGIRAGRADWVLTLNPDLLMEEDFVRRLVDAGELDRGAGAVCGKLLSIGPGFERLAEPRIDSTGIFFTPTMRHFDRGWHAAGRWRLRPGGVRFRRQRGGGTVPAGDDRRRLDRRGLLRPRFLRLPGGCRRGLAGAIARLAVHLHAGGGGLARAQRGAGRAPAIAASINMHSVKNRFLMRIKNSTAGLYRRCRLPMAARDLAVVAGCLVLEPRSLPAFWELAKCWRAAWSGGARSCAGGG